MQTTNTDDDVTQLKTEVLPRTRVCFKSHHRQARYYPGSRAFTSAPFKLETKIEPGHTGAFHAAPAGTSAAEQIGSVDKEAF